MKTDNFAVFIVTNGRPNKVKTFKTLRKQGYTGLIYIIVDNEDDTADEYRRMYGDKVVVFDKVAVSKTFDVGDNFSDRRGVVYARNACFDIGRKLCVDYFLVLDDDYSSFVYKFDNDFVFQERGIKDLDSLFDLFLEYYKGINCLSIAMAQNGDFIGGKISSLASNIEMKRKCMNTFFCSTDRPFKFMGRINEDVNAYTSLGYVGELMLTITNVSIIQTTTQKASAGMTGLYLSEGTYVKSFYTVMYAPYCTQVVDMGDKHRRLHHRVRWNNAVPCIISEDNRREKCQTLPGQTSNGN